MTRVYPPYQEVESAKTLRSKIAKLTKSYKLMQDYLMDRHGSGITIRHNSDHFERKPNTLGFVSFGSAADNGLASIYVNMLPKYSDDYGTLRIANTLVHEVSHAVALTSDYFYYQDRSDGWSAWDFLRTATLSEMVKCRARDHKVCKDPIQISKLPRYCAGVCDSISIIGESSCPLLDRLNCFKELKTASVCKNFCAPQIPGFTGVKQLAYDFGLALANANVNWKQSQR